MQSQLYKCDLENLAARRILNPTANPLPAEAKELKAEGAWHNDFIKDTAKSWSTELEEVRSKRHFGCFYIVSGEQEKIAKLACVFQ
ncbi:hypothetical protein Y032_0081g1423 [Ancylostoma ceylanicum]|uniref:SCP domain-containing protein n=1 Tax=Ancylostoma ceylanicum TaxID=53326 RepID=A0A016TT44_9BILA|nr:hypothetical protein Y032_0081g1423 [Ancylostoma ceylanicum]